MRDTTAHSSSYSVLNSCPNGIQPLSVGFRFRTPVSFSSSCFSSEYCSVALSGETSQRDNFSQRELGKHEVHMNPFVSVWTGKLSQ